MNTSRKKKASLSGFEQFLKDNKIQHHLIKPRTPQHNGKVERFNKTLKREMSNILLDGLSMNEIKKRVHCYIKKYNYERRHSSLNYFNTKSIRIIIILTLTSQLRTCFWVTAQIKIVFVKTKHNILSSTKLEKTVFKIYEAYFSGG